MDLNEIRKKRLVNSYINGAIKYNLLMGKKYEITVENGNVYEIEFNKEDYKHLCGIQSTLNDRDFFDNCLKSTITTSNINTKQKKDWNSLKGKERIIQNIDLMIYGDIKDVLLLDVLYTNTATFPIALRNDSNDSAIAFAGSNCHARSLRKARHSLNVKNTYRIIQIGEKLKSENEYKDIIYKIEKTTQN